MIQILHAAFVYQSPDGEVEALRDVSFDVQEGEFCSNVGMNMTTAFTMFARRTVRENRIPFEVSADCRRAAIHQVPVDPTPVQGTAAKRPEDMFEEIKQDFNI